MYSYQNIAVLLYNSLSINIPKTLHNVLKTSRFSNWNNTLITVYICISVDTNFSLKWKKLNFTSKRYARPLIDFV